jgi:hypothetical protein
MALIARPLVMEHDHAKISYGRQFIVQGVISYLGKLERRGAFIIPDLVPNLSKIGFIPVSNCH